VRIRADRARKALLITVVAALWTVLLALELWAAQDQAARTCTGIESGLELSGQCDLSKRLTKKHVISTGRLLGFTSYSSRGMGSPLLQLIAAPTNVDAQSNLGPTANATTAGHTYYVATTGSDSNSGSSSQPFLTLQKAADIVKPGDTVIVRDGVYSGASGSELLVITHSGTADAPITFRAEHKGGAQLDGHNNAIATGVKFEGSSYVSFQDFDVHGFGAKNGGGGAFWVDNNANHITISGNNIHDLGRLATDTSNGAGVGIYAEGDYLTLDGNKFSNIGRFGPGENGAKPSNNYWQNHDHGIYLDGASHVDVLNNTFQAHEHGWAIQVYGGTTTDLQISNNTFTGANPNEAGQIVLSGTIKNADISHNFFDHPQSAGIEDYQPNFSNVSIHDNTTTASAMYEGSAPSGVKMAGNVTSTNSPPTQTGDVGSPSSGDTGSAPPPVSSTDTGSAPPPVSSTYEHVSGTNGNNHLVGTDGSQALDGLGGRDWLEGRGGNDQLNGGAGQDKLDGGAGNDILGGGAGKDQFIFRSGSGNDVITDFQSRDVVNLSKAAAGAADYSHLDLSQTDKGVVLTLADGSSVTFEGLSLHDLDQHNFMLIA
jgi:Ca2+-binding RTX toxin-like protein